VQTIDEFVQAVLETKAALVRSVVEGEALLADDGGAVLEELERAIASLSPGLADAGLDGTNADAINDMVRRAAEQWRNRHDATDAHESKPADPATIRSLRAALEVLALRHAAPHLTPSILDQAEEATVAGDNSRDVRSWEEANRRFHSLILAPCGMPRLLTSINDLHAASARFLFASWRSEWEVRTDHDHRAILTFLRQGNIENAAAVLERHVQWIGQKPVRNASGTTREAFAIVG
jgi:DNA-binding FadR family transcriptional regulator